MGLTVVARSPSRNGGDDAIHGQGAALFDSWIALLARNDGRELKRGEEDYGVVRR